MWTEKETVRALRGERAAILRAWQMETQACLWHLDKALFGRKSHATLCASETLTALIDSHQLPAGPSLPASETDTPAEETETPAENGSGAENASPSSGAHRQALRNTGRAWTALPVEWGDLRTLLRLLTAQTDLALKRRGAPREARTQCELLFDSLTLAVAEARIGLLEQQQFQQREEALTAQHLSSRFLANASHEVRTPLTAILGFAELLLEESYGELSTQQRTVVGHIENSAQNLLEIINNLLDILQIRTGRLQLRYRQVVVEGMLQNLYEILVPLAQRKSVQFTIELPENLGAIEADENIVRHIIYHLLASALRATPAGGQVLLSARRDTESLQVFTHDTALHLPPEAAANMANPFPRLENSPARGYEGWEIGLPLIQRYLDLYGGSIAMTSLPGQGTTFCILLPLTRPERDPSDNSSSRLGQP